MKVLPKLGQLVPKVSLSGRVPGTHCQISVATIVKFQRGLGSHGTRIAVAPGIFEKLQTILLGITVVSDLGLLPRACNCCRIPGEKF